MVASAPYVLRVLLFLAAIVGAAGCGDILQLGDYSLCGPDGAGGCGAGGSGADGGPADGAERG